MKISIIIPVYNVENYLKNCLDSILKQKFQNYEIILVDDGSTDNSGNICDKYSEQYENIKVIHQKNGGASSARNNGIKNSTGKYIMFIDSDDFLYEESCLDGLNVDDWKEFDIIQYKMLYYYEKQDKYIRLPDMPIHDFDFKYVDILKELSNTGQLSVSPCNKIVKREIIIKNNIFFDETIVAEDIDWSLKLYLRAKSIKILNKEIYVYRQQRKGSVTSNIKMIHILSLYKIISYWYNHKYDNDFKKLYINYLAYQYVILLTIINKNNCTKELKEKIYELRPILKCSNNKKVKLCNKLFKLVGINMGASILKIYLLLKNKGIVKM